MTTLQVIGRTDSVSFFDGEVYDLPAKIDTGAYRSSVWATDIQEKDGILSFILLGKHSPHYSGQKLETKKYKLVRVENSFGHKQERYSVFLNIEFAGQKLRSNFTLASRGSKRYAVLIGRKTLNNRFLVDVSKDKLQKITEEL